LKLFRLIPSIVVLLVLLPAFPRAASLFWQSETIHKAPVKEPLIALTFDDGPHPEYTIQLLDVLDSYNVKATFFLVGNLMEKYPDIVKQIVARGHAIGNHTYSHPPNMELETHASVITELDRTDAVIKKITGMKTDLFRPPKGLVDGNLLSIAEQKGFKTILWTVCADNREAPTPELMAKRVTDRISPGAIILAHDGRYKSRWKDVAATPIIIERLIIAGYHFVTVPELIAAGQIQDKGIGK